MYVSNPATTSIQSTNNFANSWVHGRLERAANAASPFYLFPVGKIKAGDSLYAPVKLTKFNTNTARYVTEYFPAQPFDRTTVMSPPIDHISDVEYWEITSNIASGPDDDAKVSLSWRGYSRVSTSALRRDSLLVTQYIFNPAGIWDVPGGWVTGNASGADSLFGYATSTSTIGSFTFAERRFTLGTYSPYNALPVKLLYFTALPDNGKVRLNWHVEQEVDTRMYEIEKSTNGTSFSKIAQQASLQKDAWIYTDYDAAPVSGWNYYRLRITDKLNKQAYSGVAKVYFDKNVPVVKLFPNPTTDVVNIQLPGAYAGKVTLQLYSSTGALISSTRPSSPTVQLNVRQLAAGSYFVQVVDGKDVKVYPFVKQ
jgi:Secretion system C-terminal sorting domain